MSLKRDKRAPWLNTRAGQGKGDEGQNGVFPGGKGKPRSWLGGKMTRLVAMNLSFHQRGWSRGRDAQKRGGDLPVIGRNLGSDAASVHRGAGGNPRDPVSDCFVSVSRKHGRLLRLRAAVTVSCRSLRVDTI